jgi:ribosomal protein L7Ae-like RNA K-turn-binding protein
MVRWVCDEQGAVVPDLLGRSFGRGAWVHPRAKCMAKLIPALSRSFKATVTTTQAEALEMLVLGAHHRIAQLLGSAHRQKHLVFGGDVCEETDRRGQLHLLIVATDARAASTKGFVERAVVEGRARSWGTKANLGQLLARSEVALIGVTDRGLAQRLFGAIAMALLAPPSADLSPTARQENELSSEDE